MKPWAGYIRVSHVGGRTGDRFRSPTDQAQAIKDWARRRGEPVILLPPELDESGGRADRPILTDAVRRIEAGEYRGLVVAYLSRAGRSVRHMLELWDRIERAGGEIHAVAENIDTTTPAGRLTRTMLAAIAEHELDLHRERFEALRAEATKAGIWQRRQTPRGYRRDPRTRRLVPDRDAPLVRRAYAARLAGASWSELARMLGMTAAGAQRLIANRVYLGELRVGRHINPRAHPPLVDAEIWHAAQRTTVARPPRSGRLALLAGLVRCAGCGHMMSRSDQKRAVVYACHGWHSAGRCPAPASITMRRLDEHVEPIALAALARLQASSTHDDRALKQARAALREAEAELAAYLEAVSAADIGPEAFAAGAKLRRQRVDTARARLARLIAAAPAGAVSGDIIERWPTLTVEQRNHLLRHLIEAVLVRKAGRGVLLPPAQRVRIVAHGVGLVRPYKGGGGPMPIQPIWIDDPDDPRTLRMQG